jgi:hypothetical protein
MIRILSLGMPLEDVELVYWFLITGAPMIVAALLVARTLGLTRYDLGLTLGAIPVQLAIGALGVGVGIAEYFILKPDPLIDELTWQQAWWPALILLVATGFGEELVFRGSDAVRFERRARKSGGPLRRHRVRRAPRGLRVSG